MADGAAIIFYSLRQFPNTESSLTAINNKREQPLCCLSPVVLRRFQPKMFFRKEI
jgi:hypothetical protein